MMSVRRILLSGIVAAFVPEVGATNNGLVLLQRHAETVEADVENSTAGDDDMFDVLHEIKAMDFQLQRKARQQSRHLASTVAEYNAKLKTEEDVIASITQTNARIRQEMEAQQSQNADLRKTLNITKRRLEHVAHDFSTMATSLSETRKNLDVILQEDVELTPPHEISALQIEEVVHPDDAMKHLNSSLDNIHSELEVEISEKFNETYNRLSAHQKKLTRDQQKLNVSLAFERRQGAALHAHIERLEKLISDMAQKDNIIQNNVETIDDVVLQAKLESSKRVGVPVAMEKKEKAVEVLPPKKSEATKPSSSVDERTPGFFGRAVQASKAALASAGKKVASVFGGAQAQEEAVVSNASHKSHKTNTSHETPVAQNASEAKPSVNTTHETSKQKESLLQRHTQLVPGGIHGKNRTAAKNQMLDALQEMKAMDLQLQNKAREQSEHLATTVAEYNAKLKTEKQAIAEITKKNAELHQQMEEQQSKNDEFRIKLNTTKQTVEHVARNLGTMSASLKATSSNLDIILQEDVELTPPHELSALQIADDVHPDDEMIHLKSSLENIHSEMETGMSEKFNETYSDMFAEKNELTREQEKLNRSIAFERRQGDALDAAIYRLGELVRTIDERHIIMQKKVSTVANVVLKAKIESSKRAGVLLAKEMGADMLPPKKSETTKPSSSVDERTPGFFGRAVQASKAALASAGKKVASVFGGAQTQEEAVVANASHTSHKTNASHKPKPKKVAPVANVAQNVSHAKKAPAKKVAPAKKAPVAAHPAQATTSKP
eukprot:TRINITY_DN150_c0_g1_i1.p1 TRINITY_DN150_c0_g1~~TRINITY_DN150_c0_g1_i1.p1  ORF type:complete len:779 (+),score=200.07 TRINITY_DN150_c0_g1_i1:75-2411(+)